jgi:hypothetical protein
LQCKASEQKQAEEKCWISRRAGTSLVHPDVATCNNGNDRQSGRKLSCYKLGENSEDVEEELDNNDYLIHVAKKAMRRDGNAYMLPESFKMGSQRRRKVLYSNVTHLERYLQQAERVVHIAEWRLEYLNYGKSKQSEDEVAAEIRALEEAISVHRDGRSNNERLVHDYLAAAADRMIIDIERSIQGTLIRNEPAFSESLSPYMVRFIESFPMLEERFCLIRDTEKMHFPDRFVVENRDRHMSGGQQNRYKHTAAQNISSWDGNSLTVDDFGYPLQRIESHSHNPKTANTLPQSSKVRAPRLLHILQSEGESDSARTRDPTSPQKPPETDYFRPPLPKRTTPLHFMGAYPDAPDPSVPTTTYIRPPPPLKNQHRHAQAGRQRSHQFWHKPNVGDFYWNH